MSSLSSVSVGWFIYLRWLVHAVLSGLVHILLSVPALSPLSIGSYFLEALVHILLSVPALSLLSIGSHFLSLASKHWFIHPSVPALSLLSIGSPCILFSFAFYSTVKTTPTFYSTF